MPYDIGAKLELDGEAQFKTAIRAIDSNIKALGAEMAAVTSQFAGNEKSMEALTAKSAVLYKQIAATKEQIGTLTSQLDRQKSKLAELGDALEKAKEEFGENSQEAGKAQNAYNRQAAECNKLQAQLNNATASLYDMAHEAEENGREMIALENAADDAGDDVDDLSSSADKAGKSMKEAESGTSKFAERLKSGLAAAAKAAGAAVAAATTAVIAFAKASLDVGSQFDAAMSQVAAISGAAGEEFDALRDKAMEMGSKTKFSATESAEAFNYMAMAGWKTEDMLNGIEGIMNLAAASGESLATTSDIVTDALTAFGLSASDSAHFADVLAVASSNANTNVGMMGETFKYVAPVAGTMGYSAEDAALAIGLMANSGIKASQAGTALRSIITRLSTDAGASSKSLGALGTLTEELGVQFYNADGSARDFGDVLMETREAWSGLTAEQQINYANTIAGQEALAGWNAIMNASEADVTKLADAISNADGAALQMANTMQDNLAGDITIFKSALEGAQITLSDELTPSLREFVQFGTGALSTLTTAFQEGGLNGAMSAFGSILSDGLNMIIDNLPMAVNAGAQLLGALGQGIIDNLPTLTNAAVQIIVMLVTYLIEALPEMLSAAGQIITALISGIVEALPQIIEAGGQMLDQLVSGIETGLPDMISRLPQVIDGFLNFITEHLPDVLDKGTELLSRLATGIINAIPQLLAKLPQIITSFVNFVTQNLPKIAQTGVTLLLNLVKGIIGALPEIGKAIPKLISAIVDGVNRLQSSILDIGINIVRGIWDGISNMASWIKDKVSGFFGGIVDGVKDLLGIHSPSTVFAGMGENMALGVGKGWDQTFGRVKRDIESGLSFGEQSLDVAGNIDVVKSNIRNSMTELMSNSTSGGGAGTGDPGGGNRGGAGASEEDIDILAAAFKKALDGVGVYMSGRKVGHIVTNYRSNDIRSRGSDPVPV